MDLRCRKDNDLERFRSLFCGAAPLFKSVVKADGKQLLRTKVNVLKDVTHGENAEVPTKVG